MGDRNGGKKLGFTRLTDPTPRQNLGSPAKGSTFSEFHLKKNTTLKGQEYQGRSQRSVKIRI